MVIEGKRIASGILARVKERAARLPRRPRVLAIVANETAATRSYLSIKQKKAEEAGCDFSIVRFPPPISLEELLQAIDSSDADAILVQLPLSPEINAQFVCDAIPLQKDADVLSTTARKKFEQGDGGALIPPVAGAVAEILKCGEVDPQDKRAVIIGTGDLVGKPCALWLNRAGAEVTVLDIHTPPEAFVAALCAADIIVSGAGSPALIKPDMIKNGVVLIDAGTSESSGKIVGDADPACAEKSSLFTPVPGGVGPIAVAKLFENAVTLLALKT